MLRVVRRGVLAHNSGMREVTRSALVGQPPQRLYELIADVERYPEFVPGCVQARIESREGDEVVATLGIRRGVLDTAFTTRNRLVPGKSLTMRLERGPFKMLEGEWTVEPIGDAGCNVTLRLRFEFENRLAGVMMGPVFEDTARSLVDAFVARARRLAAEGG